MQAMQTNQALIDLTPTVQIMLLGVLIALGPSVWVWMRHRKATLVQRLRALTLLVLFLTFDLVLFGAFTRLTDSGLGCPDWPGCYASASPVGAKEQISAEQLAMPSGPVTHQKAWIEMVHRYAASAVGVFILGLATLSWKFREPLRRSANISPWWTTGTLLWVCLQGAFGALTVTMKLFPAIVTLHLLGGMVLLALLQAQATRYNLAEGLAVRHDADQMACATHAWLVAGYVLLWVQIALGGWVSTNYAVLVCNEFPKCQGQWIPEMHFFQGFELWRELGQTSAGNTIALPALTAIHVVHRMFAFVVCAVLGVAAWYMLRHARTQGVVRNTAWWIAALLLWQLVTGLSNVVLGWPLLAAVAHTAGAAGLVVVLTRALCIARVKSPIMQSVAVSISPLTGSMQ
jgi:heme a synthase